MDQEYDFIVLGTGLKECILSGLLSVHKKSLLHMDRNSYYGGESASLNLEQLYEKFQPEAKVPNDMGRTRDYNVDLCPKMIMACGNLVKLLLHTKVTRYLEFRSVQGSFVFKDNKVHKVPATPKEAMSSELMGMFQKRNFRNFVNYVNDYDPKDNKTWQGMDLTKATARDVYKYFSLDDNTVAFTGHALALHLDDNYLDKPADELIERIKLYVYSLTRYGSSPYIYPVWGLGGLPEGFSRLCAVHGGVYMLNKPIDEILYDADGKVTGVRSGNEVARCKKLLADPTYFLGTNKIRKVGQVAKAICILSHPIPDTSDADSCQIIIPQKQIPERKSDIYIASVSYHHKVAPEGKWIAVVSAVVETNDPHKELVPALRLLGKIDKEFFWVSDLYAPTGDGSKDNVYITTSYDATSHFETATNEVIQLYKAMTGEELDMTISTDLEEGNAEN